MVIVVRDTRPRLADDLERIPAAHAIGMRDVVNGVAVDGNRWASRDAKRTAGRHGKHYHKAFKVDRAGPSLTLWTAEYGPLRAMKQGNMAFERGPGRQTAPHLNLAKSADIYGPQLARRTRSHLSDLFWIGG